VKKMGFDVMQTLYQKRLQIGTKSYPWSAPSTDAFTMRPERVALYSLLSLLLRLLCFFARRRIFMRTLRNLAVIAFIGVISIPVCSQSAGSSVGIFDGHTDVGTVLHHGSVDYSAQRTYTISGSGENMWFAADAFQFVWKKVSGDVTLTADISFLTATGNEHKKAAVMLRKNLDEASLYADVALHASGLTSLQFRDEKGAITREIQANISAPKRLRIAKRHINVIAALGDLCDLILGLGQGALHCGRVWIVGDRLHAQVVNVHVDRPVRARRSSARRPRILRSRSAATSRAQQPRERVRAGPGGRNGSRTKPAARETAAPPEEPPGVRVTSQGLLVVP